MLDWIDSEVLMAVFIALIAVIAVCVCIGIAYFVLRRAVRWGIDHSETGKAYRAIAQQDLKEKYRDEE